MEAPPLEQYATLESKSKRATCGIRSENEASGSFVVTRPKNLLMTTFQDYDCADQVLHVNLARTQLAGWFPGDVKELSLFAEEGKLKRTEVKQRHAPVKLTVPDSNQAIH